MTTPEPNEMMDAWRERHPQAALAEAISVAIGCVLRHEPSEAARAAAVSALIRAHQAAIAEFESLKRGKLN